MQRISFILMMFTILHFKSSTGQSLYDNLLKTGWDKVTLDKANTAAKVDYLTDEEKQVILVLNLARIEPAKFSRLHIITDNDASNQNEYYRSLVDTLSGLAPLPALLPNRTLSHIARAYADSTGKTGFVGHGDFNGRTKGIACSIVGENIAYGSPDAISIVKDLLLDEGVPSLGHRKNMLEVQYKYVGVGISPHRIYDTICVMDFSTCDASITPH